MSPSDKDQPLGVQTAPKPVVPVGAPAPVGPVTGSLPAEPMPSENRRLPKADARPAPVLALLKARWPWLVVSALLGTVIGLILGANPTYQGVAELQIAGVNDSVTLSNVAQTYERDIVSEPVRALASQKLQANGIALTADALTPIVEGKWVSGTQIVEIIATSSDADRAAKIATAVQQSVIDNDAAERDKRLAELVKQFQALAKTTVFGSAVPGAAGSAEASRVSQLGTELGSAQVSAVKDSLTVQIVSDQALTGPAGASRPVSAGLGGTGGLILGAFVALAVGAGRRRVRSSNELKSLAPELNLRSTTQAGEVAGRLLESGHSTLVVLSLPATPSSASRFAAAVANHLRTHGSSVTLVNAIALESSESSSMALPDEVWVLRRDIRQDVKSYFSTDVLVVACTAEPEAVGLISGQTDLMAVVVAKEGRSSLQQIWDTVSAVETADPIVVLAP